MRFSLSSDARLFKKSAEDVAADVLFARAQSPCIGIVLQKSARAAETLPSWQLCCVQVQSHIIHTHTYTLAHTHTQGLGWPGGQPAIEEEG